MLGEPPVCSLQDAYNCFVRTEMDYLVLGNSVVDKRDIDTSKIKQVWKEEFTLD